MAKISIDFGTSFSSAAFHNQNTGKPQAIIFQETGDAKMPTVAYIYDDGQIDVGKTAFDLVEDINLMPVEERKNVLANTVFSIKSKLKRDGVVYYTGGKVSHEDIVAAIIKKIKNEAETVCNFTTPLTEVTITHPVVFEQWKKELLVSAARKAGFAKINLLKEPIAAAVGYLKSEGINSKGILVYDFGGGTFDVAYVKKDSNNRYQIPIQPLGELNCGGDDIDRLIYNKFNDLSMSLYKKPLSRNTLQADIGFLFRCRKNKEKLSRGAKTSFLEIHPSDSKIRLKLDITIKEFERLITPIVEKTIVKTKNLLDEINRLGYPLEHAILIGGSSRLPLVSRKLKEILPIAPQPIMETDIAVALGGIYDDNIFGDTVGMKKYIFCIYCGKENDYNNKFCTACGKKLFKQL